MDNYSKEITILYVEDEQDVREGYTRALQRVSKNLFTAKDGVEGLELFKEHRPDIIISDIKMPNMNGLEMARAIREIDENANIIFTTAHSESAYLLEAIELHAEGYLLKPVQKNSLVKIVQKLSKRVQLEKENEELKIELSKLAFTDSLTGIYNRHKFEELFAYELKQSQRYKRSLSLAILDIDHFKDFNDKFGHLIGDEILIMLSEVIQNNTRKSDLFARWGGEEFIILFSNTNLHDAMNLAENFRKIIEKLEHKSAGSVTASFGLTEYQQDDTLESMFKRADDALYEAKNSGRNCIRSLL